jgi:transcription antitermination factor NusG
MDDENQRPSLLKSFASMRGDMVERADRAKREGARPTLGADSSPEDIRAAFKHATLLEPQPIAPAIAAEIVTTDHRWLVATFAPRLHDKVQRGCKEHGWVFTCPKSKEWQLVKRPQPGQPKKVAVERPLFGTYGFLRPDNRDPNWLGLDRVDGLGALVRRPITKEPITVPLGEVEKFARLEAEGLFDATRSRPPKVKRLDKVLITGGPFAGIRGLVEMTVGERVKVLMDLLGAVDVSMDQVEAVA